MNKDNINILRKKYQKICDEMKTPGLTSEDLIGLEDERYEVEREIIKIVMEKND